MIKILLKSLLLATTLTSSLAWTEANMPTQSPVVLELFTSQGCSSCPPAERYLQELAKNHNVIALSFHIDYWDYLGWKDPFSSPANTQRQRDYSSNGRVFTPELRINGSTSVVGSNRAAVANAIQTASKVSLLTPTPNTTGWQLPLPHSHLNGAKVNVFKVQEKGFTKIKAGENSGLNMPEINIVTAITPLPDLAHRQTVL